LITFVLVDAENSPESKIVNVSTTYILVTFGGNETQTVNKSANQLGAK
jgi:hypothetical protein